MKIKEVEELVHMNGQTIRYYDKLGFLHPNRDENGYRNYTMEDIKILKRIRFLRELDISLELIGIILDNPDEFQNVLEKHIQTLKVQVNNLETIERKCEEINKKNIPLLDAIVDGGFQDISEMSNSKIKDILKKTRDYIQPYSCITLGKKTTPFELIRNLLAVLLGCIFITSIIYVFIYNMLKISIATPIVIAIVFVVWIIISIALFHEKFFEFRDKDFYIYDSSNYNKLNNFIYILKNITLQKAYHYNYSDIERVSIKIIKKYTSIGYGISKCFNVINYFKMNDGHTFMLDSSFSIENKQQRKTVFDILDFHNVVIEDKQNFREGIIQEEMSLYDYLDNNI